MIWNIIVQILISVALSVLAYALAPKPKQAKPAQIDPADLEDPTAEVGRPIPVVFGTTTVRSPNVLYFADKGRIRHAQRRKNPNTATYHLSVHYGICHGPVDFIRRIRVREKTIFGAEMSMDGTTLDIDLKEFGGGLDREGGLQGRVHFQNGSSGQLLSEAVAVKYEGTPATLPGYRNLATAFFTENPDNAFTYEVGRTRESVPGFWWSANSPFIPPTDFMVTRIPDDWYPEKSTIQTPLREPIADSDSIEDGVISYTLGNDANPAHIIREVLTNRIWGAGIPESLFDDPLWRGAASALFDENLGLSMTWLRESTIEDFVQVILNHIDATIYVDRRTGLFRLKLLRDDYDVAALTHFDETNSSMSSFARRLPSDIVNEVNLSWTNPTNEKNESVSIQNLANVNLAGGALIPSNVEFPGVRNSALAWRLAERELASESAGLIVASLRVNRSAWSIAPGDAFLLTTEENNVDSVVMRCLRVNYGRPGDSTIQLEGVEDIFSRRRPDAGPPGVGIPPGRPRDYTGQRLDSALGIQWNRPVNVGGDVRLRYEYQIGEGPWITTDETSSLIIRNLVNGQAYRIRVRAVSSLGPGYPTRYITLIPSDQVAGVPGELTDFEVTPIGFDFNVEVVAPADDGGSPILRFQYRVDSLREFTDFPEGATVTRAVDLEGETEFSFYARAVNAVGGGPESGPVTVSNTEEPLRPGMVCPPMPTGPEITVGILVVALFWDNPFETYQNHLTTRIYRNTVNDLNTAVEMARRTGISYVDEDVEGDRTYYYWIRWESTSRKLGPSSAVVSGIVRESPEDQIDDLEDDVFGDPLTGDLLSPINRSRLNFPRVFQQVNTEIDSIRSLVRDRAFSSLEQVRRDVALERLGTRITDDIEARVRVINGSITALEGSLGGRELGPEQNSFVGSDRMVAESVRNAYAAENPEWLAQYAASSSLNIILRWGTLYVNQRYLEGAWVDNGLPLITASALTALRQELIEDIEGRVLAINEQITMLRTDTEGARSVALQTLRQELIVDIEGRIIAVNSAITNLEAVVEDARAAALQSLRQEIITDIEGRIRAVNEAITILEAGIGGRVLGPVPNRFDGADREVAEDARDAYAMANAAWLAMYDANSNFSITLNYGSFYVRQRRVNSAWVDAGEPLIGITALNALRQELTMDIEGRIRAVNEALTRLEASFGGRALGPEQNRFEGDDRAAAEAARDAYAMANAAWLAMYDADDDLNVSLNYGSFYIYQRRINNAWVDNGEPLLSATALTLLRQELTMDIEGRINVLNEALTSLEVTLNNNRLTAINSLRQELIVDIDGRIQAVNESITALELSVDSARATAIQLLRQELTMDIDGRISLINAAITALEASFGGRTLGPVQNMFEGDDRVAAEAARDAYAMANAAWLAMYDADDDLNISLNYGSLYIYQRRINSAWVDNGEPLLSASALQALRVEIQGLIDGEVQARIQALTDLELMISGARNRALTELRTEITRDIDGRVEALNEARTALETTIENARIAALNSLRTEITRDIDGRIDAINQSLTVLETTIGNARTVALSDLRTEISRDIDGRIGVLNEAITGLQTEIESARAQAIMALRQELTQDLMGQIAILNQAITALEASFGGRMLGPQQNTFSGNGRSDAEATRDAYAAANPTWLPMYDADDNLNIELQWGVLYVYQRRVSGEWSDNGEALVRASAVTNLNTMLMVLEGQITVISEQVTLVMAEISGLSASAFEELSANISARRLHYSDLQTRGAFVSSPGMYSFGGNTHSLMQATRTLVIASSGSARQDHLPFLRALRHGYLIVFRYSETRRYIYEVTGTPTILQPNNRAVSIPISLREQQNATTGLLSRDPGVPVEFIITDLENSYARWSVQTQVGDLVGGVGLVNDGNTVRFVAVADRFAVVNPGGGVDDATAPFIVSNGRVFIRSALIQEGTIDTAHIREGFLTRLTAVHGTIEQLRVERGNIFNLAIDNEIRSSNYQANRRGFRITDTGAAEFNELVQTPNFIGNVNNVYQVYSSTGNSGGTLFADNTIYFYQLPIIAGSRRNVAYYDAFLFHGWADTRQNWSAVSVEINRTAIPRSNAPLRSFGGGGPDYTYNNQTWARIAVSQARNSEDEVFLHINWSATDSNYIRLQRRAGGAAFRLTRIIGVKLPTL